MKKVFIIVALSSFISGSIIFSECKKDEVKIPVKTVPTISTAAISEFTATSAVTGGYVSSDGGAAVTVRGIAWSTTQSPIVEENKTTDGTGSGSFSSIITGLLPETTYYFRAYATNNVGTAYGTEITFTTTITQKTWPQIIDFPGGVRYGAASFSIGAKAYVGLGFDDGDWPRRDFWEWDQMTNTWSRKADFPGSTEGDFVSFSIGSKGYVETGGDYIAKILTNEFWEFDPISNNWTKKASIPTTLARDGAVGFSIGTKGYIGIGSKLDSLPESYYRDFWEWDPETNVWTKKADFPGSPTYGAVGFSIGDKGYVGTGEAAGNIYSKEFWEWDQGTNEWTRKADFGGIARAGAVGISIGNKGYIGTGHNVGLTLYNDIWEWDQAANKWSQNINFGGIARNAAVGFSIINKGYVGTGATGVNPNYALKDFWELTPK